MRKYPTKRLIEETKALIRLQLFLKHDCGLKYADRLSIKSLKRLLRLYLPTDKLD